MSNIDFSARIFGKWILAGEHAVLRGAPALVFPVKSYSLEIQYEHSRAPLGVQFSGEHGKELNLLFWGVIEEALKATKRSRNELVGEMVVQSSLPIGTGLGASAALCVAVGRWCRHMGWVSDDELYEFCRGLEDLFHGESSGVDIAASLSGKGIVFERGGHWSEINVRWAPKWYLSYSGCRGMTSDCVQQVKRLFSADDDRAQAIDQRMIRAALHAKAALESTEDGREEQLAAAIRDAASCFEDWGLADGELGRHMQKLYEAGATAVKPTGSGGGGYVISLWQNEPPESLQEQFISL